MVCKFVALGALFSALVTVFPQSDIRISSSGVDNVVQMQGYSKNTRL